MEGTSRRAILLAGSVMMMMLSIRLPAVMADGVSVEGQEGGAIYALSDGALRVVNCTASENRAVKGKFAFLDSDPRYHATLGPAMITNSIIVESGDAIYTKDMSVSLRYSLLSAGLDSVIDPNNNITWGIGNIDVDPGFAAPGHWDANNTSADTSDDFYAMGDYHLKSQAGRFDPSTQSWVRDDVTSHCIDAGDPNSPIGLEPFPNGGRINMGAYAGTAEASKSYFGEPICGTIMTGDINGDCRVDFFDLSILVRHWCEEG